MVDIIFLSFDKAFDTVLHRILLDQLSKCVDGVLGEGLGKCRAQRVVANGWQLLPEVFLRIHFWDSSVQ